MFVSILLFEVKSIIIGIIIYFKNSRMRVGEFFYLLNVFCFFYCMDELYDSIGEFGFLFLSFVYLILFRFLIIYWVMLGLVF